MVALAINVFSQVDSTSGQYRNSAEELLASDSRLTIGGYGEVKYNQGIGGGEYQNGELDVHRVVMLFGYKFNERTQFITELEYEHVKEIYVEQAFLQYKVNNALSFRGGLLLIPMGIINEYHEPTTFNGVNRPEIDKSLAPTTWREIGFGATGNFIDASVRYQAYVVNGFNGYYDGEAKLSGSKGYRSGRQKGAESYMSSPNFTAKVDYYGLPGLSLGLSGYFGKTQSDLYDGIEKEGDFVKVADSSVVGISMIGADARYNKSGLQLRGQFYYSKNSNTDQYNAFTGKDLGSTMMGYYAEAGYNVFAHSGTIKSELVPFFRYESYNNHASVEGGLEKNKAYNPTILTYGFGWKMAKGAVLKIDFQSRKTADDDKYAHSFNAGIGVMF